MQTQAHILLNYLLRNWRQYELEVDHEYIQLKFVSSAGYYHCHHQHHCIEQLRYRQLCLQYLEYALDCLWNIQRYTMQSCTVNSCIYTCVYTSVPVHVVKHECSTVVICVAIITHGFVYEFHSQLLYLGCVMFTSSR